jgi:hypothetical protein
VSIENTTREKNFTCDFVFQITSATPTNVSALRTRAMNGHSSGERFVLVAPMATDCF